MALAIRSLTRDLTPRGKCSHGQSVGYHRNCADDRPLCCLSGTKWVKHVNVHKTPGGSK